MGRINVLSFAVANLIAAGEVVDRPSSVIKELLENAIDSGADRITVEIQNGGVTYMRVADNGCGIEPDDLPVAIRRHATSKIKGAEDLDSILTLGFRGEALAAIASVSDMRIISKTADAQNGAMLEAHGGNIVGVSERAASKGTTVIVENLFANVPARRKFLKKDVTEAMAVSAMVEKIALSKPHICFKLIIDGNVKLETIGDGNMKNCIYSVFGREFASRLIQTSIDVDGVMVEGFIGRPDNVRPNRNYQNFFINGRYVKSRTAGAAIEQAYTSYIAPDKFPCCVLFLTINPSTVDVNVHPAKLEVKFSNEKPVFEAIYYAVKNALEQNKDRPGITLSTPAAKNMWAPQSVTAANIPIEDAKRQSLKARQIETPLYTAYEKAVDTPKKEIKTDQKTIAPIAFEPTKPIAKREITAEEYIKLYSKESCAEAVNEEVKAESRALEPKPREKAEQTTAVPIDISAKDNTPTSTVTEKPMPVVENSLSYRIIGEVFNSYVIVEKGDTILLVDKHAAHERIIFEGLKAGLRNSNVSSQMLMLPIEVMMTSDEIQTLGEYRAEIEAIGFEFTLGRYTVNVSAIPEGIGTDAVPDMLLVMAERIKSGTGSAKITRDIIFEKALYQASCKAAIKAGREYSPEHIKWIIDKLMKIPDITVCPHGRPVAMEISHKELDKQFERT